MYNLHLEIRHFTYLKRPKTKWTMVNDQGGSFSNSGEYPSLRACGRAIHAQYPHLPESFPVILRTIHGYTDNGQVIESAYEMTLKDMFGEKEV